MGDLEPRALAAGDPVLAAEPARDNPVALWCELDAAWEEAFRQAWEALRTGDIAVGACVSRTDGTLVAASRNRSVRELNADIRAWITTWNENPKPFVWTKTADEILGSVAPPPRRDRSAPTRPHRPPTSWGTPMITTGDP